MTKEELNIILEKHKEWLNGEDGGERADLSGADLSGADLDDGSIAKFVNTERKDLERCLKN